MAKKTADTLTIGELYRPAMAITEQAEADCYFAFLVGYHMGKWGNDRAHAERTERENLGYFAGYYDSETRARVERLFSCAHPIFGAIAEHGTPTTEDAIAAGIEAAKE